eukprot:c45429_g1_i1.p1 GENE.c45429_g1_i1~~c45429_g1_i1.p1  ORF type:complete len:602 (+),score=121.92 c45429_g1_i1:47-1852(+)
MLLSFLLKAGEEAVAHSNETAAENDHGEEDGSIFVTGKYMDTLQLGICFTTIVGITMLIDFLMENLDAYAQKASRIFKGVKDKMVQEIFILGIISFSIFLAEQIGRISKKSFYHELEFVHVLILFIGVFYVLQTLYLFRAVRGKIGHWRRVSQKTKFELLNAVADTQTEPESRFGRFMAAIRRRLPCKHKEALRLRVQLEGAFKRHHLLPSSFDFFRYLSVNMSRSFVDMVDTKPLSWLLMLGFLWAMTGLQMRFIDSLYASLMHLWLPIGYGYSAVMLLLYLMLARSLDKVLASECTSLDAACENDQNWRNMFSVTRQTFFEEMRVMRERQQSLYTSDSEDASDEEPPKDLTEQDTQSGRALEMASTSSRTSPKEHMLRQNIQRTDRGKAHVWDITQHLWIPLPIIRRILNFVLLANSVYAAYFFALSAGETSLTWIEKVVLLSPIVFNLFFVIPQTVGLFEVLNASMYLESEAFDEVLSVLDEIQALKDELEPKIGLFAQSLKTSDDPTKEACALRDVFRRFQNPKTQTIGYREMMSLLRRVGVVRSRVQVRKLLQHMDTDSSGDVSLSEFLIYILGQDPCRPTPILPEAPDNVEIVVK